MDTIKLQNYLNRQLNERTAKISGYDELIAKKEEIERQIAAYGDVEAIKSEITEIQDLISGLVEPTSQEIVEPESDINITAIINSTY